MYLPSSKHHFSVCRAAHASSSMPRDRQLPCGLLATMHAVERIQKQDAHLMIKRTYLRRVEQHEASLREAVPSHPRKRSMRESYQHVAPLRRLSATGH